MRDAIVSTLVGAFRVTIVMSYQQAAGDKQQFRHRIQQILLEPQTSKRDIFIELLVDGVRSHTLPRIEKGQKLLWSNLHRICDVREGSTIIVQITKVHRLQDRVGRAKYQVSQAQSSNTISINCEDKNGELMFDVRVDIMRKDESERAFSDTLARMRQLEVYRDPNTSAGRARTVLKTLDTLEGIAKVIDPSGGAQAALSACINALEFIEAQRTLDKMMGALADNIIETLVTIESIREIADVELNKTVTKTLHLIEDASIFIVDSRRADGGMTYSTKQGLVDGFMGQFVRTKQELSERMVAQNLRTSERKERRQQLKELKELKPVDLAGYDPSRQCLDGTRVMIIDNLTAWAQADDDSRLAWVHGLAGLGKSSIATSVCKRLDDQRMLASSFFCKRDSSELRDPRRLLMTVVCGLAQRWEAYATAVVEAIRSDIELNSKHLQPLYEALVGEPLRMLPTGKQLDRTLVVIVDALDECGDVTTRRQLLVCLRSMSRAVPQLKIMVTSRPDEDIKSYFCGAAVDWFAEFNVLQYHARDDVRLYVQHRLRDVATIEGWPDNAVNKVSTRADGLFIWARTACTYIVEGLNSCERLRLVLSGAGLADIDMLYTTVLLGTGDTIAADDDVYTRKCLGAIVVTAMYSPLSINDLAALMGKHLSQRVLERVVGRLSSVLYKDTSLDGAVRVSHPSFMDFITTPTRSKQLCVDLELQNQIVAECCLRTMTTCLRFNICELETSDSLNQDVSDLQARVSNAIAPYLSYSCIYWSNHLAPAPVGPPDSTLRTFLCGRELVYWLEALSLLGKLSVAPFSLLRIMLWCSSKATQDCRMIANDAYRFVLAFYDPISSSTPHLYISAIAFAPFNSHISMRMRNMFPNVLTLTEGGDTEWTRCIRSISVGSGVSSVAVSPDGQRIASGCIDSRVRVWDAETGEAVFAPLEGHSNVVQCVVFSHDGSRIISGSHDQNLLIWDTHTGEVVVGPLRGHSDVVWSVACSLDGRLIASGSGDRTVRIWNADTGDSLCEPLQGHQRYVRCVRFSSDSRYIVSGSDDCTVRLWEVKTGDVVLNLMPDDTKRICCVGFSSDGQQVVSVSSNGTARRWDSHTGMEVTEFSLESDLNSWSAELSLDSSRIISGAFHEIVCVWDASTGNPILGPLTGHSGSVNSAVFSPNGDRLVSGSDDKTIRIWDANLTSNARSSAGPSTFQQAHSSAVGPVTFSSTGRFILSGSHDLTVRVWNAETGHSVLGPLEGHSYAILSVAFSPDDSLVASSSADETVRIWDAKSGQLVFEPLQGHSASVQTVVFSPDGSVLATGSEDKTMRIWCAQTGSSIMGPLTGHSDGLWSVAFSPDSCRVVSGSGDMTLRIWDIETGDTVLGPLSGHAARIISVAFSLDGNRLISGSTDSELRIWDAQTGHVQIVLPLQLKYVTCISFSHDRRLVISSSADGKIYIFDIETGNRILSPLRGHSDRVQSVAISPDNRRIASGSTDLTVRIWNAEPYLNLKNLESWLLPGTQVQLFSQAIGSKKRLSTSGELSLYLSSDSSGWVTTTEGKPLLWLPHELRVLVDQSIIWISKWPKRRPVVDFTRFVHGEQWTSVIGS